MSKDTTPASPAEVTSVFESGDRVSFVDGCSGRKFWGTVVAVSLNARRRMAVVVDGVDASWSRNGPRIYVEVIDEDGLSIHVGGPKWRLNDGPESAPENEVAP
jgi:hypothetical protein